MPQYLTTDQYKQAVQTAQQQGMNPDDFLNSITKAGVVVQGYNDQQYNYNQGVTKDQNPTPSTDTKTSTGGLGTSIGSVVGNFGIGLVKGMGRQLDAITQPLTNTLSSHDGVSQEQIAASNQASTDQFTSQNTAQKVGGVAADIMTGTAAAMTGEIGLGVLASGAGLAGKALTLSKAIGAGLGLGTQAFATTNGTMAQRADEGVGQAVVGTLGSLILPAVLSKVFKGASGGYEGAMKGAQDIIDNLKGYRGSAADGLIKGAEELTAKNPEALYTLNPKLAQDLVDAGVHPDMVMKPGLQLTPTDVQKMSSAIPYNPMKPTLKINLTDSFRGAAQQAFDAVNPQAKVGTQLEELFSTATDQYHTYDKLANVLNLGKDPSAAQADELISFLKQKNATPQGQIALRNGINDFAKSSGIDLSNSAKVAQYEAKLGPLAKKVFHGALLLGGYKGASSLLNHFGF